MVAKYTATAMCSCGNVFEGQSDRNQAVADEGAAVQKRSCENTKHGKGKKS